MSRKQQQERDQEHERDGGDAQEPYEVGYRKPPKDTQFKEGNKAGKGRTKGAKNLETIINETLNEKVAVKIDGEVRKVRKKELIVRQVISKATAGDRAFATEAVKLMERYEPREEAPSTVPARDDPDIATLRNYLDWHDQLDGFDDDDGSEREEDLS